MDPQQAQTQAMHMMAAMIPIIAISMIIGAVIYIIPLWQICKKAGLSAPLSLIALIPYVGQLIVLYVVAFSDWKVPPATPYGSLPPQYPPPPVYPPQGPTI